MAAAVQGIFAGGLSPSSAPAIKPSSSQASEGADFQSMLDQATPTSSAQNNTDNPASAATDSTDAKSKSGEKVKRSHGGVSATRAVGRSQKTAAKQSDEDESAPQADAEAQPSKETTVGATLQPDAPVKAETEKLPPKDKPTGKSRSSDDAAQAATVSTRRQVQAINPRQKQQPDSGKQKDPSRRAAVQAVSSGDPRNASETSPQTAVDASANSRTAEAQTASKAQGTGKQTLAIQPRDSQQSPSQVSPTASDVQSSTSGGIDISQLAADDTIDASAIDPPQTTSPAHTIAPAGSGTFADLLGAVQGSGNPQSPAASSTVAASAADDKSITPEAQFAQANHAQIVSGIHGQLLPTGGNMQIRLDPPELGALNIIVRIHEGIMSAAFETSNDQATRLLSHSLSQLKVSLEAQGVSVGKLHVQQSPRNEQSNSQDDSSSRRDDGSAGDNPTSREQQRREMLRRMWQRLSGTKDPLDLVA